MISLHTFQTALRTGAAGLALAMTCLCAVVPARAQDTAPATAKVGFVSLERILRDSAAAKAAQAKLETEFAKRSKDLQDMANRLKPAIEQLERNSAVMTETERNRRQREVADQDREFQRKQREFNEDLNQRRNEELAGIVDRANRVVKQMAEAEKFDLIVQEAVYVNPRIDITERVIRILNNQK